MIENQKIHSIFIHQTHPKHFATPTNLKYLLMHKVHPISYSMHFKHRALYGLKYPAAHALVQ